MWSDLTSFYVFVYLLLAVKYVRICKTDVTEKCMWVWGVFRCVEAW